MNQRVGNNYLRYIPGQCREAGFGCGYSFWSPVNKEREFYRIEDEPPGRRFYIQWIRSCRYSILVDEHDTIVSWRMESETKDCYVF